MYTAGPIDQGRIETLLEMLRDMSVAESPLQVMSTMARNYWRLRPIDYMISASTKGLADGRYRVTRRISVADVLNNTASLTPQPTWKQREQIPVHAGGFLGGLIAHGRPQILRNLNIPDDPVLGAALAGVRSALVLPLYDEGKPNYWNFQFRADPNAFDQQELETAMMISNLTGGTNTRLLLVEEIKALNAALRQQFDDVARVQRLLLPRQTPDIPGLEIATSYLTSEQAGGDYYDFFRFEDGTWGILIADVSGHGAAAATVMAMFHGILHAYNGPSRSPDAVLAYANRRLLLAGIEGTFVTAFLGIYEPETGRMTYARSGHNPPLIKDGRTGVVSTLDGAGSLPLGVLEPYEISMACVQLKPMDTVVLYTDGITEAMNAAREMFELDRLEASLTGCSGAPDCVVDSVHGALFKHTGSLGRKDDQTLVAIRYHGARA